MREDLFQKGRGVAIGEEEAEVFAGGEFQLVIIQGDSAVAVEVIAGDNLEEGREGGAGFDGETDFAVAGGESAVFDQQAEPVAGGLIVVVAEDGVGALLVVFYRHKIGTDEEKVVGTGEGGEAGGDGLGFDIGHEAKAGDQAWGRGGKGVSEVDGCEEVEGDTGDVGEMAILSEGLGTFADEGGADIRDGGGHNFAGSLEGADEAKFLAGAAASETEEMNGGSSEMGGGPGKRGVVNRGAASGRDEGRIFFVQGEPGLGLGGGGVVEFGVDATLFEATAKAGGKGFGPGAGVEGDRRFVHGGNGGGWR